MVALCNRADHYIFALWFLSIYLLLFSLPSLSGSRLDVYHTSTHDVALSEFRMHVWNVLLAARCKYRTQKVAKNRHLGTMTQLRRTVSSQLMHVSTIGKKHVKQQYLLHMFLQYGELRPSSGWDPFVSLGTPANFNGFRVLAALLHGI